MIRSTVKKWLLSRDTVISRPVGQFSVWEQKLQKTKARGLRITSALDGGAARGDWTREFKAIFPDAKVIAVDPRDDVQSELQLVARELSGVTVAQTLLGDHEGAVKFNEFTDQSSILPSAAGKSFGTVRTAPMTTIDKLVEKYGLPGLDLIKLDLQGAELIALSGAPQTLRRAQAVLLEVSFFRLQQGTPLAGEVIAFMHERGFRLYDIAGLWHRPLDGALAQGDFLFVKEAHPLVSDERWSAASS